MTLLTIAVKNVRHELRRYTAFFLSSAFAVWLFFQYASLLAHPEMHPEKVPHYVRAPLEAVQYLVGAFAVLFILYAQSSFFKARQKELSIYSTLGMLPGQTGRLLHYENLVVGVGATTVGVVVGTITQKLFLLATGLVMGMPAPLPFRFSWQAVAVTYLLFLVVFTLVSLLAALRLRRLPVAELIRSAARPKAPPAFAWWKVAAGVVSLGTAYGLMLTATPATLEQRLLPILVLMVLGTALLLSQGSVALLVALRRRPVYWRGTRLLTLSQMAYKVRDNARVLFMVSMLSMGVLIAASLSYGAYETAATWAEEREPVHLFLAGEHGTVDADRVEQVLMDHGVPPVAASHLPVVADLTLLIGEERPVYGLTVASVGALNEWATALTEVSPLTVDEGQAILLSSREVAPGTAAQVAYHPFISTDPPEVGAEVVLAPSPEGLDARMLLGNYIHTNAVLVVTDDLFARLQERFGGEHGLTLHGYDVADWRRLGSAVKRLEEEIIASVPYWRNLKESPSVRPLVGTWVWYQAQRQDSAMFLFTFTFIGMLFFLAAGNMLYFKLLNDVQDDRLQFQALHKVGIRPEEVARVLSTQALVLFFAPLAVGLLHAAVALWALSDLSELPGSLLPPLVAVAALYLLLQGGYFLVARRSYVRAVLGRI